MAESSGTPVAIEELLEHSGWVRKLARQLLPGAEAAEDLVQQTWLSALEHPPRDRRSLTGWLRTLMQRSAAQAATDERARAARESKVLRPLDPRSAADLVAQAECQRMLVDLVLELPDPYRSTLLLRYFGDQSLAEIAARTGTPSATVRAHHHRALEELRRRLAARGQRDPGVWRSIAVLGGSGAGAHALGATGAIVMSLKAKLAAAALVLAALTTFAIWSPWIRDAFGSGAGASSRTGGHGSAATADAAAPETAAHAGSRPETIGAKPLATGRALFGRVVDPEGVPVPGANVVAYPATMTALLSEDLPESQTGWPRVTRTDADGTFAIADLALSPALEIVAVKEGWQPALQSPLRVNEPMTLTLSRGVRLRGRVRDFGNEPIPRARVTVTQISGLVRTKRQVVADGAGNYEAGGVGRSANFSFVAVEADGFATQWINYLPAPDAAGLSTQDFYLGRGVELGVTAIDGETGSPLPNARIVVWAQTQAHNLERPGGTVENPLYTRVVADIRAGPDGRARVTQLPSWGVHRTSYSPSTNFAYMGGVAAAADGYAIASKQLELMDEGSSQTVTLELRREGSVAGRVVDESGRPLARARIWFSWTGEDAVPPETLRSVRDLPLTDSEGAYVLPRVPSSERADVEVKVSAGLPEASPPVYSGEPVLVHVTGNGTTRAPDIVLKTQETRNAIHARFRVIDESGAPLWGARIDEGGSPLALTDEDGRASFALPKRVDSDGKPDVPLVQVSLSGFATERLTLDPAIIEERVVRLRPGLRIKGRVIHPDGEPATQGWVQAAEAEHTLEETFPPEPKPGEPARNPKGTRVSSSGIGTDGAFELAGLRPGKHHLEARIDVGNQRFVQGTLADVEAGSTDVLITVPRPPPAPQGRLTVSVRDRATKRPILRCDLRLTSTWREAWPGAVAPGVFAAGKLEPGRWTLKVLATGFAGHDPVEVTIADDPKPVVVEIELERGATMRGRLKIPGDPSLVSPRPWVSGGPGSPSMTLAPDGGYTITGLKPGGAYDVSVSHQPKPDVWETFVTPTKVVVPDQAGDVVTRDLELVRGGGLGLRIKAPRLFGLLSRIPESDEQWQLARDSRVTVRSLAGAWSAKLEGLRGDHYGWQAPFGRYVVRLEVPGAEPQEVTVTVGPEVTYADFTVP